MIVLLKESKAYPAIFIMNSEAKAKVADTQLPHEAYYVA